MFCQCYDVAEQRGDPALPPWRTDVLHARIDKALAEHACFGCAELFDSCGTGAAHDLKTAVFVSYALSEAHKSPRSFKLQESNGL